MTNRVIVGNFDGAIRLRVSRPTYDVFDTTLPARNLAFDSTWDAAANVYTRGSYTLTTSTGGATWADPGYIPAAILFWEYSPGQFGNVWGEFFRTGFSTSRIGSSMSLYYIIFAYPVVG